MSFEGARSFPIILLIPIYAMSIGQHDCLAKAITIYPSSLQEGHQSKPAMGQGRGQNGEETDNARRQALLRREAKITMDEAREIARSAVSGDLKSGELTRDERGKPVYNFHLQDAENHPVTVRVSALTGRVLLIERAEKTSGFALPKKIKRVPHSMKKKWSTLVRRIPI